MLGGYDQDWENGQTIGFYRDIYGSELDLQAGCEALFECVFVFCLCSYCLPPLLRPYASRTYSIALTTVHLDGKPILSLHITYGLEENLGCSSY
jgi:hypothetical protein